MAWKDKLVIVVSSCDAYADVWDTFFTLFFRYWPDCPFPVYLLANGETYPHPLVRPLRIQPDRKWATNLRMALDQLATDYVLYIQEDYFLDQKVKTDRVIELIEYMVARQGSYLRLFPMPGPEESCVDHPDVGDVTSDSPWRTSLQAAVWHVPVLRSLLVEGESAWDMEQKGRWRAAVLPGPFFSIQPLPRDKRPLSYFFTGIVAGRWARDVMPLLKQEGLLPAPSSRPVENRRQYAERRFWEIAELRRPIVRWVVKHLWPSRLGVGPRQM
jgi:hypothetical protein